jgi:hypothetical protein
MPMLARNFRPRSMVTWVACAVAASDAFAIASGSPGAPALMSFGSVGSHWSSPGAALTGAASPITTATAENSSTKTLAQRK